VQYLPKEGISMKNLIRNMTKRQKIIGVTVAFVGFKKFVETGGTVMAFLWSLVPGSKRPLASYSRF